MLRIVRYDQRSELSSVFLQRFYHQFFFLFNKHLFFSKQSRISRAHFSCGEIGRSGRIKDKTRSQGLTYVLRVFRFSPVTRNLDFRIGYTWREGEIPWQERASPAFAPLHTVFVRSVLHRVLSFFTGMVNRFWITRDISDTRDNILSRSTLKTGLSLWISKPLSKLHSLNRVYMDYTFRLKKTFVAF